MLIPVGLTHRAESGDGTLLTIGIQLDIGIIIHGLHGTRLGVIYFLNQGGSIVRDISKTLICHHQGTYGSTIRIDVKTKEWLEYFKKAILTLIEEENNEIEIGGLDNVEFVDIESLKIIKVQRIGQSKVSVSNDNDCFTWLQGMEDIITLLGLIDGLLEDNEPGHQYLTTKDNVILIVLSYNESM